MVCPVTNTDRGHPFHIRLDGRTRTTGVVMCDQVRMLDLNSCRAAFEEKAPADVFLEAVDIIAGFLDPQQAQQ